MSLINKASAGIRTILKAVASTAIDKSIKELNSLSDEIWRNPELNFKEFTAHRLLTDFLEREGFKVERSFGGLETAFRASFGSGGRPNVCVICEYDALPDIGHACGHNLIAEAGVAAGVGVKAALEHSASAPGDGGLGLGGTITVMGTPAEEGGGGKVKLIENGSFEGVDLAMMVHPSSYSCLAPDFLSVAFLEVTFTGKASHAAAFPWEGVNALDAAVVAYNSISVLRQQMKPSWRVHSIIKEGGVKPNIIPDRSVMELMVRTPHYKELEILVEKVNECFRSAAKATGTEVVIDEITPRYKNLVSNSVLAEKFGENWKEFGVDAQFLASGSGSTDMGNVSYLLPSIHPKFKIGSGEGIHTREFTALTNTPEAHLQALVTGKVMAHTCIDVMTTDGLLEEMKDELARLDSEFI